MSPALLAVAVFVGGALVVWGIMMLVGSGRRLDDRLSQVAGDEAQVTEEDLAQITGRPSRREEKFGGLAHMLEGRGILETLEKRLVWAGLPLRPTEYLMIWAASGGGMFLISLLLGRGKLTVILCMTGIGVMLPNMLLKYLHNKRRTLLETQLADALTMIASGLKAGYTVLQGMQSAADQLPDPISSEFGRVAKLVNVGMDFGAAMRRMGSRIESYDYDIVITAINIQLRTGGNLAGLLETIAATIRDRITLRREINAATSQGKLSGAVLVLLPVGIGVGLFFINREYASLLFKTSLGKNLLKMALVQQMIGIWIIKRLLDFDA